jgi:hypothetical protein
MQTMSGGQPWGGQQFGQGFGGFGQGYGIGQGYGVGQSYGIGTGDPTHHHVGRIVAAIVPAVMQSVSGGQPWGQQFGQGLGGFGQAYGGAGMFGQGLFGQGLGGDATHHHVGRLVAAILPAILQTVGTGQAGMGQTGFGGMAGVGQQPGVGQMGAGGQPYPSAAVEQIVASVVPNVVTQLRQRNAA